MTLKRFQQFQIGALDAMRLNEMVDAITRLQARVEQIPTPEAMTRDRILARITGQGTAAGFDQCTQAIPCVSYPFTEIYLKINPVGNITASTCVGYEIPVDAIEDRRDAYLLVFEKEPTLKVGDVVVADLASMSALGNAQDKHMVYVSASSLPAGEGQLRICTLEDVLPNGKYTGFLNDIEGDKERIDIENLYETQNYYGAAQVTLECAEIVAGQRLPLGSDVWAMKVGGRGNRAGEWVTMTPTPFGVECTCGDLGQPLALMNGNASKETVAAGIISRIMGA